jgi:hypothetical protein
MIDITRRQALAGMGSLGASLGLSACATPITPFCPTDPTISDPFTPLTIDVHTHVFNGSDLQIGGFFEWILGVNNPSLKDFGKILAALGRDFAPSAAHELAELQRIEVVLRSCDTRGALQVFDTNRQSGYTRAVDGLNAALESVRAGRIGQSSSVSREISQQIHDLPRTYSEYRMAPLRRLRVSPESITVSGGIDFIIRNFQFRYVNVYDYLTNYSQGKARRIDLLIAHLVDFDWPIGGGQPTPTSLSDQVRVMERISALTGGRVQCFAPYDPMKEVAFSLGLSPVSSLQLVKDAVLNHGFIGVKLYPPMGFAPLDNASFDKTGSFWNQIWIPSALHRSDLGVRLDNALSDLYSWCQTNGVPIMAHTSPTNGPSVSFEGLTKTKYWRKVRDAFSGIRVDFGHFGDSDLVEDKGLRARHLSDLMDQANGQFLYADSAYFADLLSRQPELQTSLASLMQHSKKKGPAALAQRLMYGTDWEMVVLEGPKSDQYLQRFEDVFSALDNQSLGADGKLSDRFFGVNAAIFLGLKTGQPARQRLDQYYGLGSKPAWMSKVDKVTALAA